MRRLRLARHALVGNIHPLHSCRISSTSASSASRGGTALEVPHLLVDYVLRLDADAQHGRTASLCGGGLEHAWVGVQTLRAEQGTAAAAAAVVATVAVRVEGGSALAGETFEAVYCARPLVLETSQQSPTTLLSSPTPTPTRPSTRTRSPSSRQQEVHRPRVPLWEGCAAVHEYAEVVDVGDALQLEDAVGCVELREGALRQTARC